MSNKLTFLRLSEVRQRTGLSRSHIYELQSQGFFPHSVKLTSHGTSVAWVEAEIEEWMRSRLAKRKKAA